MTSTCRAAVTFDMDSGLPEDRIVQTFHFRSDTDPGLSSVNASAISQLLTDFYLHTQASGKSIRDFMSTGLKDNPDPVINFYDDDAVGSPIQTGSLLGYTDPTASGDVLPNEVALCLSIHADLTGLVEEGPLVSTIPTDARAQAEGAPATHSGKTRPKASHRGRIYLGPFGAAALSGGNSSDSQPNGVLVTTVTQAASRLMHNSLGVTGIGDWAWAVRSKKLGQSFFVTGGWVDNAWDTQRRRGRAASSRTTFS